jgi:aspartate oxidase
MREQVLSISTETGDKLALPVTWVHTLVIGSGAAGLNAAVQLCQYGVSDVLIVTEGLQMGTSINTGSDKQTYYKLSMCGAETDSPATMAETYFAGGSMHGDLALVEASLSARAFMHLVNLGVPFPRDRYGQFVGYKTDHDSRQRATSIGPYTSREMCRVLIRQVQRLGIPVRENRNVVELLMVRQGTDRRVVGAVAVRDDATLEAYAGWIIQGQRLSYRAHRWNWPGAADRSRGAKPSRVAVRHGVDPVSLERVGQLYAGHPPIHQHRSRWPQR